MRTFVYAAALVVALTSWATDARAEESFDLDLANLDLDVVEQVPQTQVRVVTPEVVRQSSDETTGTFLGLSHNSWVELTGISAGALLLLAVLSRWVRPRGRALLMLRLHKTFAYGALLCALAHATLNLAF